jgi:16S rRNA (guanine(966)-N(2))-methyltransferase RsmD
MNQVRITAGSLRGRRIPVPRDDARPERSVRPTSERARQAYFNIVGDRIEGARFLDLFAGSGIFSFEAVSRGALSAVAVEASRPHVAAIGETAKRLGVPVDTVAGDAIGVVKRWQGPEFDLIYADPPYDSGVYDDLLSALDQGPLAAEALVAVEHRRGTSPFTITPARLEQWRRAEYGEVWLTFFRRPQHLQ